MTVPPSFLQGPLLCPSFKCFSALCCLNLQRWPGGVQLGNGRRRAERAEPAQGWRKRSPDSTQSPAPGQHPPTGRRCGRCPPRGSISGHDWEKGASVRVEA